MLLSVSILVKGSLWLLSANAVNSLRWILLIQGSSVGVCASVELSLSIHSMLTL